MSKQKNGIFKMTSGQGSQGKSITTSLSPTSSVNPVPPLFLETHQRNVTLTVPETSSFSVGSVSGLEEQLLVPTVFQWNHGGKQVYITGTFNNWSRNVPMHITSKNFSYLKSLPRVIHTYKFIVDDEWKFAPEQPTVTDADGNINNLIDLTILQHNEKK